MQDVLVYGCYGYKNVGNDAVLSGTISRFKKNKLTIISFDPKLTSAVHNIRSISKIRGIYELIKSDKLLIAGDELINDEYYERSVYYGFTRNLLKPLEGKLVFIYILLAYILGKKIEIHGIGIGKIGKLTKRLIKLTFPLCHIITVRDKASYLKLKGLNLNLKMVTDPSVDMNSKTKMPNLPGKYIVLTLVNEHDCKNELTKIIDTINQKGYSVIFIPFSQHPYNKIEDDNTAWKDLNIKNKMNQTIRGYKTPATIRKIIGNSKGVIGMRMHSIIFAGLEKVPAICIPYSKKHKEVLENLELSVIFANKKNLFKKSIAAIR
jgi:polysaccharide pyruvyl transferase WcaK-like protein